MKYYLIAGERSGDLHGSNLIKGIRENDPDAQFRGWGGDMMQAEGMELVTHYKDTAFMGFLEVILNLHKISGLLTKCKKDMLGYKPDALVLIDYPGFNLRIAAFAKAKGLKVFYYISPKVWAWNQKRALKIRQNIDHMFVIFPFEVDFYKKFDFKVDYVGNPLMDAIANFNSNPAFRHENQLDAGKPVIALLPGSRRQEIIGMLDLMLAVQRHFPEYQFVIAGVRNLPSELYARYTDKQNVSIVYEATYDLLSVAAAALVTSGTATLETALFNVPEVVCYKTSGFSYAVAKRLIRVPFISLVNLIMEKEVVKELIQDELNETRIVEELTKILPGGSGREIQLAEYATLHKLVGGSGASARTGNLIVNYLRMQMPQKPGPVITIVDYTPEYAQAFYDLNFAWISETYTVEEEDERILNDPEKYYLDGGGAILVTLYDNEPVGTCALKKVSDDVFEMSKMTVLKKMRGKKIGELLGRAIIQKAKDLNAKKIILFSNRKGSAAGINLYEKLGFTEVPLIGQDYKRADIKMELSL